MNGSVLATSPPRSWAEALPLGSRVRMAVVAGLIGLVYWNTIRHALIAQWINDGNWSHGWLIPVFSLYFLGTRREALYRASIRGSFAGAAILILSLAAYFYFSWFKVFIYPQAVSIVGTIFGATLLLGGWGVIRVAWFPILFLLLAIPLPERIYVQLTMPQQVLASSVAATVMPWFAPGLYTEAQAVVIDYMMPGMPPGRLNVEEACSGMRMMMAFVTLGAAMAYLGERPVWQRAVMMASCVPIAVLCNTIRVTTTGLFFVYGRPELGQGTPHQLLGIAMLGVAFGLYSLIGYVLSHLFVEESEDSAIGAGSG